MAVAAQVYAERAACQIAKPLTREEHYQLLHELAMDLISPDAYGHAIPPEVVRRASRIVNMTRPGYGPPPPVRCEKCDAE